MGFSPCPLFFLKLVLICRDDWPKQNLTGLSSDVAYITSQLCTAFDESLN